MELIELQHICKTYKLGDIDVPVLKGVSLTVGRGELVALMGASGSGKSTLMNILGCLDRPSSGRYWLDGQEMSGLSSDQRALARNRKIGFVFQNFNLLPRYSALKNTYLPLKYTSNRTEEGMNKAAEMLELTGLAGRLHHRPSQLSGGECQRVAIARALVNDPDIILADEPTGNLDSATAHEIMALIRQLHRLGQTIVMVTHEADISAYAGRIITLRDGKIINDSANP